MSEIKSTTTTARPTNLDFESTHENAAAVTAEVNATTESDSVQHRTPSGHATTALAGANALGEPATPTVKVDADSISGARSFAGQLDTIGGVLFSDTDPDSDALLASFLKLQVVGETADMWGQVLAREAQSLLMLGALEMGKSSVLKDAEAAWAKAEQLQNQALGIAGDYEINGDNESDLLSSAMRGGSATVSLQGEEFNVGGGASPDLAEAIEAQSAAERAEAVGDTELAKAELERAEAAFARYLADPGRAGDTANIDGTMYDIGAMSGSELTQVIGLLAQAAYELERGNALYASYHQGIGASQMRKGQPLIDSMKRLEGHDQYLQAVMTLLSKTSAAEDKLKAMQVVDEQRTTVASLLEEGAGYSDDYARNRIQPMQG